MPSERVDVLFLVDASASMKPCFDKLITFIEDFIRPLNQAHFESVRLGFLAYKSTISAGKVYHQHTVIGGNSPQFMRELYSGDVHYGLVENDDNFFTRDIKQFCEKLKAITPSGDENSFLALDTAADFPFEPAATTRRVIAWFTDEKIEEGITKLKPGEKILEICKKFLYRKIALYAFTPDSPFMQDSQIGRIPRAIFINVPEAIDQKSQSDTWDAVNFQGLMEMMGKSISESSLQQTHDDFTPATYGQNSASWDEYWATDDVKTENWIEIRVGDSVTTPPLKSLKASLYWRTPIDLDLHGFVQYRNGRTAHIYYGDKKSRNIWLDRDAGVGGIFDFDGYNEEIMTVEESTMPEIAKMLFATNIYSAGGCFADYLGEVHLKEVYNDETTKEYHCNMESTEHKEWCVIAMIDNTNPDSPIITNMNKVCQNEPNIKNFKIDSPEFR